MKLLYVRGPLDIVKGAWEGSKSTKDSVVSHVLGVLNKLSKMAALAAAHLGEAQVDQKHWCDTASVPDGQCYDLDVVSVPGKLQVVLSRAPVGHTVGNEEDQEMENTKGREFVWVSDQRMETIKRSSTK